MSTRRSLHLIAVLFVIEIASGALIESYNYHQEKTGIVLQGMGVVAPDISPVLMSTFIKIKNPISDKNECENLCQINDDLISGLLTHLKCNHIHDKIGDEHEIISKINLSSSEDITNLLQRQLAIQCFKKCLLLKNCKAFGIEYKPGNVNCILRNSTPTFLRNSKNSSEFDMKCMVENRNEFCNQFKSQSSLLFENYNANFVNETMTKIENLTKLNQNGREKRFIEAALGFLGGSILTGVFSFYEQSKITHQLNNFYDQFQDFRNDVTEFMESTTEFHENMLKVYRTLEWKVQESIENLNCEIMNVIRFNLKMAQLQNWREYVYTLSKDLINGQFKGPVSPVIFTETDVKTLLNHKNMKNSIYSENIPLFYRLGRMWLADIKKDGKFFNLHVIISIPQIKSNEMHVLYQVNQVGLVNGSHCLRLDISDQVYQKDGKFFELDNENNCELRSGIKLCLGNKKNEESAKQAKCISAQPLECTTISEVCQMKNIQTSSGVMVRAMHHLKASTLINPTKYSEISTGGTVRFLNYDKYYQIVADNVIIRSISDPTLTKELEIENPEVWDKYLFNEHQRIIESNLSQLQANIDQQKKIIEHIKSEKISLGLTKDMTLFNFAVTLISLLATATGIYLTYRYCRNRFRSHTFKDGEKYTKVPEDIEMKELNSDTQDIEAVSTKSLITEISNEHEGLRNRSSSTPKVYSVEDVEGKPL